MLSQFATGSWNIWFSINLLDFNINFTRNHVSSNLCCYLQVVPCHLRLRARFHIRFKRHARRVGQVRHFSMKMCVENTSKTYHVDFSRKLYCEFSWKRSPFFVRAVRSISLDKQISCVLQISRQLCTCMKTKVRRIGSLYFPDVTLKDNLGNKTKKIANKSEKLSSKEIPLPCRSCRSKRIETTFRNTWFQTIGKNEINLYRFGSVSR